MYQKYKWINRYGLFPTFVWSIREKEYVDTVPSQDTAFSSLASTFRNREFLKFVGSDILYWIAITMFQTGLPFFVTSLLKLPETMTTLYFVGMTALSLVFYIPINKLAPKLGKKKLILTAFVIFSFSYLYTGFLGRISVISANVQGLFLMVTASLPMAVLGSFLRQWLPILPRVMRSAPEATGRGCSMLQGLLHLSWARASPCSCLQRFPQLGIPQERVTALQRFRRPASAF